MDDRLHHGVAVVVDRAQRGHDLVPGNVPPAGRTAVVLADVEGAELVAGADDRLTERVLLDVHVVRVEHHLQVRAAHLVDEAQRLVAGVDQEMLEAVQHLDVKGHAEVLGGLHRLAHGGRGVGPAALFVAAVEPLAHDAGDRAADVGAAATGYLLHLARLLGEGAQMGDAAAPVLLGIRVDVLLRAEPRHVVDPDPVFGGGAEEALLLLRRVQEEHILGEGHQVEADRGRPGHPPLVLLDVLHPVVAPVVEGDADSSHASLPGTVQDEAAAGERPAAGCEAIRVSTSSIDGIPLRLPSTVQ